MVAVSSALSKIMSREERGNEILRKINTQKLTPENLTLVFNSVCNVVVILKEEVDILKETVAILKEEVDILKGQKIDK
ncbi:MAG: hypothetical protein KAS78_00500 [Candidatus Pacebacteria bacterium]|nr:hypothetical protein [Candidatus Paceibacterota bacterium]